ncbi:hypothetical protein VNO77_39003 [Canavalia gladiata]|uniref:Uncharacterized protein n=1 Tax=Canavalia gladiata TaxID=3824 RepID=A0AAN9KBW1_CANGL
MANLRDGAGIGSIQNPTAERGLLTLDAFRDVATHREYNCPYLEVLITWVRPFLCHFMNAKQIHLCTGRELFMARSYERLINMALAYYSGLLFEENQHWHGFKPKNPLIPPLGQLHQEYTPIFVSVNALLFETLSFASRPFQIAAIDPL